jgi:hypothetical protein
MGDVKLSANQTAQVLKKLDDSARSVTAVRETIIGAMAARQRESEPPPRPTPRPARSRKKR